MSSTNYLKITEGGRILEMIFVDDTDEMAMRQAWMRALVARDAKSVLRRKIVLGYPAKLRGPWDGAAVTYVSGVVRSGEANG